MGRKMKNLDASSMRNHLITVALILAFAPPAISFAPIYFTKKDHVFPEFIKWHVYIVNGLSNNQNLFTHCKSTEDDVGPQNISPGSNITWSFRTDFFHSTLFWCHVRKEDNNTTSSSSCSSSASFDVFWYDARLFDKCNWKNCIWTAKDDGIYLTDFVVKADELRYRWDDGVRR